jgi:uncharacterized protein
MTGLPAVSSAHLPYVTLGLLVGIPVSIAHTENDHEIHIISFRKATKREAKILFDHIHD